MEIKVEKAVFEAGKALMELRDRRLYRSTHSTFEEYCKDRFGFERRHPYRLIEASAVFDNLMKMCPNGTQTENESSDAEIYLNGTQSENEEMCPIGTQILPTSEHQVRPITKLEPQQQWEVWQRAVEEAGGKVPSARVVGDVVQRIMERTKAPNPYRVGEVCLLIAKDNPDLRGKGGCWGIVNHVGEHLELKYCEPNLTKTSKDISNGSTIFSLPPHFNVLYATFGKQKGNTFYLKINFN